MPGVRRDYKAPIPHDMDIHVLLVPYRGQKISRTDEIPYVEIQTILPKWNNEGTSESKSDVRKLVPIAQSPHEHMEGSREHLTKSA